MSLVDPKTRASIVELEEFLLFRVLSWKLAYSTPFDFIQLITEKMKEEGTIGQEIADCVRTKAACLSDLLFLCTSPIHSHSFVALEKSASYPPLEIAIASLLAACSILKEKDLAEKIGKKYATPEIAVKILP